MHKLWGLSMVLAILGCATPPPPAPPPDPAKMVRTVVYPIIDLRAADKSSVDTSACLAGLGRGTYATILAPRNALVHWPTDDEAKHAVTVDDLVDGRAEKLKATRRGEADYALFTVVRRFEIYGASLYYASQAFLVDLRSGAVTWQSEFKDSRWLGIMGAVFAPFDPSYRATICNAYGAMVGGAYRGIPTLQRP